jgi:hypothetical protein
MMDGSLKADAKTPGDWDYNVAVFTMTIGCPPMPNVNAASTYCATAQRIRRRVRQDRSKK